MSDPHLDAPPAPALDPGLDGLWARARGVLLAPFQTFAHHDPSWGWAAPWALVAAVGILAGAISLARVDHEAVARWGWERATAAMSPAQRKAMEAPEAAENIAKFRRLQGFATKVYVIAGPPLTGLAGIVLAGLLLFGAGQLWGKLPPDPMGCLSLAAYVSLANLVASLGVGWGSLLANALPRPDPSALVDPFSQPLATAALARLSPSVLLYYVLFAAALQGGLSLPRRRAWGLAGGLYFLTTLGAIAFGALGKLGQAAQ